MFYNGFLRATFARDERATVAMSFGLAVVPMMTLIALVSDYAYGEKLASQAQSALDAAVISAMAQPAGSRAAAAQAIFEANFNLPGVSLTAENFSEPSTYGVTGSATISAPTTLMSAIVPSLGFTRSATAQQPTSTYHATSGLGENSCILTLGEQLTVSYDVMTFNGSPAVNLSGCSLRSNKSMDCNGHSTGAQTFAVGSIVGCSYPHTGQPVVSDIYSSLSSNISTVCGANAGGYAWTSNGSVPAADANKVIAVAQTGYTEIHICGDLTLSGASNSTLTGATPASDTVVVIENGGIILANGASVTANQVTFVLAGGSGTPIVSWPNGNGGNAATFGVSASTSASNPWAGMAIYENPSLDSDMTWNSGATFALDGVMYFPKISFKVSGQVTAGPTGCSKIVVGEFTLNGSVNLKQSAAACSSMQVPQYDIATTTVADGSAYLSQ